MDINGPRSNLENQPPYSEEDILSAAIEQLENGAPLAEVLAAYPAEAAWLASLLDIVAYTKQLQAAVPTPDPADHLNIFLGQAQQLGGAAGSFWLRRFGRENPIYLLIAAFALIVLLLLLCTSGRQLPGLSGLIALPPPEATATALPPATDLASPTATDISPATETATPTLTATQSGQVIVPLSGTLTITSDGVMTPAQTETEAMAQTPILTQTQSAESGALTTPPTSATDAGLVESGDQVTSTARITITASVQTGVQATPGAEETPSSGDAAGNQPGLPSTPAPPQPGDPSDKPPEFLPVSGGIGPDSWLVLGLGLIGLLVGLILHRIAMRRE